MKLLPKSKPKNYWLAPKLGNVIKLTPLFLIPLSIQVTAASLTKNVTLFKKNETVTIENEKTTFKLSPIEKQIKGKVLDESGNPLSGANISVKGTKISTQTDFT